MRKIVIKVNPDGTVSHDFIGFAGKDCLAADDALRAQLAALGIQMQTTKYEPKPELLHAQEAYEPQQQIGQQQKEA
jgi:Protein of unknown function (DUF2997)